MEQGALCVCKVEEAHNGLVMSIHKRIPGENPRGNLRMNYLIKNPE